MFFFMKLSNKTLKETAINLFCENFTLKTLWWYIGFFNCSKCYGMFFYLFYVISFQTLWWFFLHLSLLFLCNMVFQVWFVSLDWFSRISVYILSDLLFHIWSVIEINVIREPWDDCNCIKIGNIQTRITFLCLYAHIYILICSLKAVLILFFELKSSKPICSVNIFKNLFCENF